MLHCRNERGDSITISTRKRLRDMGIVSLSVLQGSIVRGTDPHAYTQ
jgi:hypothetical protein